ncbi:hypothetical protein OOZ51_20765 [Arthrobacter sp. MI7-26]|nr:hypothetical protein [Arthrobacter sp. MI7-26]
MAPTIALTRHQLKNHRKAILKRLGVSLEQFTETVRTSTLSGAEWEAKDQLEETFFLLGERSPWSVD